MGGGGEVVSASARARNWLNQRLASQDGQGGSRTGVSETKQWGIVTGMAGGKEVSAAEQSGDDNGGLRERFSGSRDGQV
jgi:hypothetical protein